MKLQHMQFNFLQNGLTKHLSDKQVRKKADILERPVRLLMHGFPPELVNNATVDELRVLEEIDARNIKENVEVNSAAVAKGIAMLFGKDK